MAAPVYATDLVDIFTDGTTTGWTALGGGASGLAQETDYFVQGTSCLSKSAWTATATPKGMIYDNASGVTVTAGDAVWIWITHLTPNSLDTLANGGLRVLIGSGTGAYYHYYIGGNNTIRYDERWLCVPVDPRTGTVAADATTGAPSATKQTFGGTAVLPTTAPTKGAPFGIDAIRYGRTFTCTNGDVTNGYASFGGNGSDTGAAAYNDGTTRTWGQIQFSGGTYKMQGLFRMGTVGTAVDFRDTSRIVFIANSLKVASGFNGFEVNNASSRIDWTSISITALGTVSRGYFLVNAATADINISSCFFTQMDTFGFGSSSTILDTTFKSCSLVTQSSALFTNCTFDSSRSSASVLCNNPTNLDACTFISDGSNHALELTSACAGNSYNLTDHTFTGYAGSDGSTGNEVVYNNSGGAVTLNAFGITGTVSVRNGAGASTTVISGAVSVTLTAQTETGTPVQNVNVFVKAADATGPFPFEESVTISNSGATATVTHTAHGLATNDKVYITGASLSANLGVFSITYTGVNTYTYTMGSSPGSSPTGSITSTFVILHGTTDVNGQITMSRVFSSDQPYTGWGRKSTSAPYYKEGVVTGSVDSTLGANLVALMISDQ